MAEENSTAEPPNCYLPFKLVTPLLSVADAHKLATCSKTTYRAVMSAAPPRGQTSMRDLAAAIGRCLKVQKEKWFEEMLDTLRKFEISSIDAQQAWNAIAPKVNIMPDADVHEDTFKQVYKPGNLKTELAQCIIGFAIAIDKRFQPESEHTFAPRRIVRTMRAALQNVLGYKRPCGKPESCSLGSIDLYKEKPETAIRMYQMACATEAALFAINEEDLKYAFIYEITGSCAMLPEMRASFLNNSPQDNGKGYLHSVRNSGVWFNDIREMQQSAPVSFTEALAVSTTRVCGSRVTSEAVQLTRLDDGTHSRSPPSDCSVNKFQVQSIDILPSCEPQAYPVRMKALWNNQPVLVKIDLGLGDTSPFKQRSTGDQVMNDYNTMRRMQCNKQPPLSLPLLVGTLSFRQSVVASIVA